MTRRQAWAEDKVPWNKKLIDIVTPPNINNYFCQIYDKFFKDYILVKPPIKPKDNTDSTNPFIYIGLKNDNNLFGDYVIKVTTINRAEFIDNTPYNRDCVNQFKLYIMSIIANYETAGSTLHKSIHEEIKKGDNFNLQEVVKILDMKPIVPVKPQIAPVKPPPNIDPNILELQIYKEFGIKCTTGKECYNEIADEFYRRNEGIILTRSRDLIRDVYHNVFMYITGSDVPHLGNKEVAYTKCIKDTRTALILLNTELKGHPFTGARTGGFFNIKEMIIIINSIREQVNKSVIIASKQYIEEI